MQGGQNTDFRI